MLHIDGGHDSAFVSFFLLGSFGNVYLDNAWDGEPEFSWRYFHFRAKPSDTFARCFSYLHSFHFARVSEQLNDYAQAA